MCQVCVVICNYNGEKYIKRCIDAILSSSFQNADIVVVDNASTDNSIDIINAYGEKIVLLQNKENLGGAGGFAAGFSYALDKGYPYIFAMDNDAWVDSAAIGILFEYLQEHPEVGMAAAKILSEQNPDYIIDFEGKLDFIHGQMIMPWLGKKDCEKTQRVVHADFCPTTASLIRREALIDSGGMDSDYFIYLDDIEMCFRMQLCGWELKSVGTALAWHKSGGSHVDAKNTFKRYYFNRNYYYFFSKYWPHALNKQLAQRFIYDRSYQMYCARKDGRKDIEKTELAILNDFIGKRRGRAADDCIQVITDVGMGDMINTYQVNDDFQCYYLEQCEKYLQDTIAAMETIQNTRNLSECAEARLAVVQRDTLDFYIDDLSTRLEQAKAMERFQPIMTASLRWLHLLSEEKSIESFFMEHSYQLIAIYGMGKLGKILADMLSKEHEIDVVYAIDRRTGTWNYQFPVHTPEEFENCPQVDVVVVTAVTAFPEIKMQLQQQRSDIPIISLTDIFAELERE